LRGRAWRLMVKSPKSGLRAKGWHGVPVIASIGALAVVGCSSSDTTAEVSRAARGPYIAVMERAARALCADFTPAAASHLARGVSQSTSCDERVAEAFARSAPFEPKVQPVAPNAFRTNSVVQHGDTASVVIAYGVRGKGAQVTLALVKTGGTWRVATRPTLRLVNGCYVREMLTENCPKDARVMLFSIGKPELRSRQNGPLGVDGQPLVPVPSALASAGGRELREFNAGMKVVAQAGCMACHRIGDQGNSGLGPNLTHLGSALSKRQIEHAIVDPSVPMPSFKNLPGAKLAAVVGFLSQLSSRT
jgi:hypothetical protein